MTGNLTTSAKFFDSARTERVVAAWHTGGREREIGAREGISRTAVRNIIEAARRNGDTRAVRRNKPDEVNSSAFWSPKQMLDMNEKFAAALITAVRAGTETKEPSKLEYGVYRAPEMVGA